MNKIKVKNDIINLDSVMRITITSEVIEISMSDNSLIQYEPGHALSQAEFDTLAAWLLNQTNNPYILVVA